MLITALLARLPKREMLLTLLLMFDLFLQVLLVNLRDTSSILAALHPLNALALLLIAIAVVRRDRVLLRLSQTNATTSVPRD